MTKPAFLSPADLAISQEYFALLVVPFWAFANSPKGPVELVMATVHSSLLLKKETRERAALLAREGWDWFDTVARPLSLKICGEGWIRIEHQLGRDVTRWPGHMISLRRGNKRGHDYIEVEDYTKEQRLTFFGRFA